MQEKRTYPISSRATVVIVCYHPVARHYQINAIENVCSYIAISKNLGVYLNTYYFDIDILTNRRTRTFKI